jgi:hypothetical protein
LLTEGEVFKHLIFQKAYPLTETVEHDIAAINHFQRAEGVEKLVIIGPDIDHRPTLGDTRAGQKFPGLKLDFIRHYSLLEPHGQVFGDNYQILVAGLPVPAGIENIAGSAQINELEK